MTIHAKILRNGSDFDQDKKKGKNTINVKAYVLLQWPFCEQETIPFFSLLYICKKLLDYEK